MSLSLTVAPTTEPVSLEEAKEHLRVTGVDEDTLIARYITVARDWAETYTRRAFITQTLVLRLHRFIDPIVLPRPPLVSVTSVQYVDRDGDTQTWAAANYTVVTPSGPHALHGWITPAYNVVYPTTRGHVEDVIVTYVAGYGAAAAVPEQVKYGILERLEHLYARRGPETEMRMYRTEAERMLSAYIARDESLVFD